MTPIIGLVCLSLILLLVLFFLRFFIGGSEDSWICNKGQWVKHGNPSYPKPENPCGKKISMPRTKDECLKIGGVWKKQGPEPFETCNIKAKDRGNICHDNSECMGWCQADLTREELSQGMRGKISTNKKRGVCSVWVVELGCFGMMKQGKTQVICIDPVINSHIRYEKLYSDRDCGTSSHWPLVCFWKEKETVFS